MSEEDQQPLLVHRISREDIYQRQGGDTIITWTDPDINTDIALSFQEAVGCNYIWEQIKSVQLSYAKHDMKSAADGDLPGRMRRGAVDEYEFGSAPGDSFYQDSAERTGPSELPPAELGTMSELVKIVVDCSPFAREKIASLVLQNGYLRKLLDLFKTCEDLDDQDGLHMMYRLVRGLVLLNDAALFDELLRDDNVMDVVGALEYDPDLVGLNAAEDGGETIGGGGGGGGEQPVERTQHRVFLRDSVVFKEVVPIQDADVRAKIHQTYRIGYLKDVILPRVLDDATFGTLTSIMLFNNVEVVLALQNDPTFLKELFARLHNTPRTNPDWDDLVGFLQELCSLAKHLQIQQRGSLFAALVQHGLFYVLTDVLKTDSESSQLKGADVLMSTLHNDPSALRAFLVKQDQHALFERIVTLFVEGEEGLQAQLFELLKLMLDPETMDQPVEKSGFLELFYDTYVDRLVTSVNAGVRDEPGPGGGEGGETNSVVPAWALVKTIELLCFCVQHHSFRIKYYVLRNNVVEKVLKLTQRREKYLVVAAVRFLRACVGLKDEFYNRYIIKNALFAPVVKVFTANGTRYNMLNSAVLELVDFIRRENIKNLIVHLVELYDPVFAEVTYVDTFRLLKLRYQQGQQPPGTGDAIGEGDQQTQGAGAGEGYYSREGMAAQQAIDAARRRPDGSMDKSEEDYFKEDDDDDEPGASNGGNGGGGDDVGFTAPREPGGEAAAGTSGAGKRALDEGSEGDGAGKKSRTDEPPAEGLTAAQRNAARGLEKVTPPSEDAGKPAEDPPESERNPKPTSKPTSSWVSVDE